MTVVNTPSTLEGVVAADANTAALVARYAEAKRQAEEVTQRVERLRASLNEKFDAAAARKFTDELGEVLIARTEVQTPLAVDVPRLQREYPAIFAIVVKPRSKFYRLNLPRISAR